MVGIGMIGVYIILPSILMAHFGDPTSRPTLMMMMGKQGEQQHQRYSYHTEICGTEGLQELLRNLSYSIDFSHMGVNKATRSDER